ncbi:hypothetical protein ACFVWN_06490 [Nocardiopsis flavescens]|uniref:hypothetical protein n=1 Tax=Nocardiopsis flavescens TaxID=758803 RepID=UPI00365A27A2
MEGAVRPHPGIEVDKLKTDYREGLKKHLADPQRPEFKQTSPAGQAQEAGDGYTRTFEADIIPGVLKIVVSAEIETGENWSVRLLVTATVFDKNVGQSDLRLSRYASWVEIHPGGLVAKADLKIGIYGQHLCLTIEGQVCYWAFGWHCTQVDGRNLVCLA